MTLHEKDCPNCNGWGYINIHNNKKLTTLEDYLRGRYKVVMCPKCLGKKKIDWIEEITGVRRFVKNENT